MLSGNHIDVKGGGGYFVLDLCGLENVSHNINLFDDVSAVTSLEKVEILIGIMARSFNNLHEMKTYWVLRVLGLVLCLLWLT